jgi:hypothetical protein
MQRSLSELEELVRNRICGVCSDRKTDGSCGLDEPGQCALFRLFPHVAEAIQTTHSDRLDDYITAIRRHVCTVCEAQDQDGTCVARQQVQCALDSYLLLIVEAIEEATGKDFGRPLPGGDNLPVALKV